ncbi:MAG: MFS transporter [Desulfosporosinus sp. BRH_c37]|nr:MAG: MFS transporter [Desulfosporosinus sp. BRH_c37]
MNKRTRSIMAVVGSAVAIFWPGALIFGYTGVMGPFWQQQFHVGKGAIGNCLFFILFSLGIFMFLVGKWQEKIGTRAMIIIGSIICSLAVVVATFATNLYMIYLWAFLTGTSSCFIYTPSLITVQRWWPERRGLVSGIVNFIFGISAAIMSPIFSSMLKTMGYQSMNILVAILVLIVGIVSAQFTEVPERVKLNIEDSEPLTSKAVVPQLKQNVSLTVKQAVRTRSFWFLWLVWVFQGAAGIGMVTLSVNFGLSKGFSMGEAVFVLISFNLMSGLSRLVTGFVSDIAGRNVTMSITFFAAGVAYFVLIGAQNLLAIAILVAVIGFAFGTLFAVSAPLVTDCFGLKHFGAIFGLIFTAYGFISGILGPSLSGYLIDMNKGNFTPIFAYFGVFCLLSGVLIRLAVPPVKVI